MTSCRAAPMTVSRHPLLAALLLLASLLLAGAAQAALITRTITINGTFTDWTTAPNILTNPDQISSDCQSATACERDGSLGSAGRDLKAFAFTWDNTNLYFYLERWSNASNVTDWWFYMDTSGDQRMNTGEKVMRVKWSGSNRNTSVSLYTYTQAAAGGDVLVSGGFADGYTMPGTVGAEVVQYSATGGGSTGLQMEARLPWSVLGLSGPSNMGFHISSSNGGNLPGNVIDNMDGPSGNQLFPGDLQVEKTASASLATSNSTFTYTVTLRNLGFNIATSLVISDVLPPDVIYLSHSASAGTFADSNANGIPDRWSLASLAGQTNATLTITARGASVTANVVSTNTASLVSYTGLNQSTSNDSASVNVTVAPTPQLTTVKTSSSATANPGQVIRYRVHISNAGFGIATTVVAIDNLSPFTAFRLNTFGAGQNLQLVQGSPTSGLTLGTAQYSSDGGATYAYTPVSGGGGAPSGHDANITHVRVPLSGTMAGLGANCWLEYDVIVR